MANNRIKRIIGAMALGIVLWAVPSCTDTWDDHYNSEPDSGATGTLWDMIKDNPNYSRFANIVRQAKYYKDNTHPVSTYTYEDVLSGGQVNTIWVPDNSALSEEEYQKWMAMLGESRADGDGEANANAGYNVQQQFIGNHIALWRHNISEPGVDTIKMINGKNLIFDKGARTLEGIPLGEYNIPTGNGVMHVLRGVAPFHYNFYEYLKYSDTPTKLGKYVVSKDTTYFDKDTSIEGLPDENGNPTYVDSVYFTSNRLFRGRYYLPAEGQDKWDMAQYGFNAAINNEDSVFIMLLPTDAAWDDAYDKLKDAYKYPTIYDDKEKGDLNSSDSRKIIDPDSLQKMSIEMDLISPLVFNIHKQPKKGLDMWTPEMFKNDRSDFDNPDNPKKYMLTTSGDTLRAIKDTWMPSSLFEGEVLEMSNGLGYAVNSLNFPSQFYTPDVEVEIENFGMFYNTQGSKYKIGPGSRRYTFSNEAYKDITDKYGKVSNNNFFYFDQTGPTAGPKVEIKLKGNSPTAYVPNAEVMSGKYDIQLVLVPHWYLDIASESKIPEDFYICRIDTIVNPEDETDTTFQKVPVEINEHYIDSISSINKYKISATIGYSNNSKTDKTQRLTPSKGISYEGLKVDTITIFENFEFPYSYRHMRYSYPTLYLEGVTAKSEATKDVNKDPYGRWVFDFVIDKIILKRKN